MKLSEKIDFLIFPPRCLYCGKVLKYIPENETSLRDGYNFECTCEKCAAVTACEDFMTIIDDDINCYSPFEYDKEPKRIILSLKSHGYRDTALQPARIIANKLKTLIDLKSFDYVTYVPTSFKKLRKRGFNQAELLAKYIAKLIGLPCEGLLEVNKKLGVQHTLNLSARKTNVKDAFKAKRSVNNKRIILIDDIVTTGSTLKSCGQALKKAGAQNVYCVTVCKTIKR